MASAEEPRSGTRGRAPAGSGSPRPSGTRRPLSLGPRQVGRGFSGPSGVRPPRPCATPLGALPRVPGRELPNRCLGRRPPLANGRSESSTQKAIGELAHQGSGLLDPRHVADRGGGRTPERVMNPQRRCRRGSNEGPPRPGRTRRGPVPRSEQHGSPARATGKRHWCSSTNHNVSRTAHASGASQDLTDG